MKLKFLIITLFISFQLLAQKPNNPSGFTENKGINACPPFEIDSYGSVQPECAGDLVTGITIEISTPAALYSFDDGFTWSTESSATNFKANTTYCLRIKDNNGCISKPSCMTTIVQLAKPKSPQIIVNQPITCTNPYGSIIISSAATKYSFDNGITYTTNKNSGNLPPGDYSIRIKNSNGCESDPVNVKIQPLPDYDQIPKFNTIQPNCYNPNGSISIMTVASEFSFNNGATWSAVNTLNNLQPGTYILKTKNDLGCESEPVFASLNPFASPIPPSTVSSQTTFCIQQNATINNIDITGQNIKWYDALAGGNILSSNTPLLNGINYYASQTINGCESLRVPVTVNILNTQAPSGDINQTFCTAANPTVNNITVNGTNIISYDSATGTNILPNSTALTNGNTYYASQTVNGCESIGRLAVKTSLISTLNANNYSELVCDNMNDGHENVNLIAYNQKLIDNSAAYTFEYYNSQSASQNQTASEQITQPTNYNLASNSKIIYIRIMSNMGCHQVVSLTLSQIDTPIIGISDTISFCEKDNVVVNAGNGFDSYLWSTGETGQQIKISQAGNYSVTVTKKHDDVVCSTQKNFVLVASNVATISNIETKDFTETENAIAVNVKGLGEYEYSLDGIHFQEHNEFSGLKNGLYKAYVRDKNGCGTVSQEVYLLMYPKFFTPNGDSYNDTWKIQFSYFEPELKVLIFDRFGKLLKQLIRTDDSWDGKYNGNDLPSDDYWFVVTRKDGSEYKGHFSLKR